MQRGQSKKVLVAMSGGVDSSVAAALLKKQGYFVVGAYMKNFSPESWEGLIEADCPWEQDVADVQVVCEKLGIEFRSFNFEKEYAEKVIEYFFREYGAGRTPNPDVMCNKEIKFGIFLQKAKQLGFDYVATGHYARVRSVQSLRGYSRSNPEIATASTPRDDRIIYELLKGADPKKDQSYFLYTLNQEQLSRVLFPIGEYTKVQIRQMAKEFGLPNWNKKDSQGVCFIGHIKLREFLRQRIPEKVGEIVEAQSGRVIGQHPGAWYYTLGQRQGIGIGGGQPYYVAQKDVLNNKLTVVKNASPPLLNVRGGEGELYSKVAILNSVHWIDKVPKLPLRCRAKIRYQQPDQTCAILPSPGVGRVAGGRERSLLVKFSQPQFAIAPGQSIVFYRADQCLGGGVVV
ncbi:MAG: tRNA 2-thiouridine(34) synthase MnmA [bacterium]|nr:tRNA 2-thiouridine(34) synthase MnmA [bacterium]